MRMRCPENEGSWGGEVMSRGPLRLRMARAVDVEITHRANLRDHHGYPLRGCSSNYAGVAQW